MEKEDIKNLKTDDIQAATHEARKKSMKLLEEHGITTLANVPFRRKASSMKTRTLSIPIKVPVDLYERYAQIVSKQPARLDQIILDFLALIDEIMRSKLKEAGQLNQTLAEYAEIAQNLDVGEAVGDEDHEIAEHYAEINVASRSSRLKTLKVAESS